MGQVAKRPNFPPFFSNTIPSFPMSTIVLGITKCKHSVQAVFLLVRYFFGRGSGYDRGHLAAAANHRSSQNSMCATFFLSNMSPQVGE